MAELKGVHTHELSETDSTRGAKGEVGSAGRCELETELRLVELPLCELSELETRRTVLLHTQNTPRDCIG